MENPIYRAEHEEFCKRIESEQHRQNRRLEALEKSVETQRALVVSVERLAANMESMLKEQEKQGKQIEMLESRDGEMWRKVVGYVVTAVVGVFVGFVFTQIGM